MLHLYRRHQIECEAGRAKDTRNGEFDEFKKGWRRCECPIFASGTLGRKFNRRSTGVSDWTDAKTIAGQLEQAQSWNTTPVTPRPEAPPQPRITLKDAIDSYLRESERHAAVNTVKKYRYLLAKVQKYADALGYMSVEQWTPVDVRDFRASWKVGPQTESRDLSAVKAFFDYCVANEWASRNPAKLVKNRRTRDAADKRGEQKLPFTDEELQRMYDACETEYGKQTIRWSREVRDKPAVAEVNRYNRKWTGQDLADFISVSVYTGLRISDVATFHIDRLRADGSIRLRTTKAGTHVYTWVPGWLQERIRARAESVGPLIFGEHTTSNLNVITDLWRRKLIHLWELCGPWKEKPTPHRFRHTFARILLQRTNVTVRDVAELLGNTEQMVLKHYSAWVATRQERLTAILQEAFDERPKPQHVQQRSPAAPGHAG